MGQRIALKTRAMWRRTSQIQQNLGSLLRRQALSSCSAQRKPKKMPYAFFTETTCRSGLNQPASFSNVFSRTFGTGLRYDALNSFRTNRNVLWAIIGLNTAVFATWRYAIETRDSKLLRQLQNNFTMSIDNWKEGRWWTVLTSSFSHNNFTHFLFNMVTFHAFGGLLARIPGVKGRHIISLCIGSALTSSAAFLADQQSKTSNREQSSWIWNSARVQQAMAGLGASGVVMGFGGAVTCLVPNSMMLVMFIIPMPLWVATLGL